MRSTCLQRKTKKHSANGALKDKTLPCSLNLSALLYAAMAVRSMEGFPIEGKDPPILTSISLLSLPFCPQLSGVVVGVYFSFCDISVRLFLIFFPFLCFCLTFCLQLSGLWRDLQPTHRLLAGNANYNP